MPEYQPPLPAHTDAARLAVNASWLLRLRWVAVAGQLLTVGFVVLVLKVALPLWPLFAIIAFTAATNLGLAFWSRTQTAHVSPRRGHAVLGWLMTADLLSLTALLYFAGGPANPFTIFYFVNLALAAVVLPSRWAWVLTAVAVLCFAGLYVDHVPLAAFEGAADAAGLHFRQQGLLVALAACTVVIIYFITRVTGELQETERELRDVEQRRARSDRLEALATLAAGAAHELASPLSTIAVVAKELTHHLEGADVPDSVREDVTLIRSELDHCRAILDRMTGHAGQAAGETVSHVTVNELIEEVLGGLRQPQRVEVTLEAELGREGISVPLEGLAQAIRGLVQNALDASEREAGDGDPVQLEVARDDEGLWLQICDRGPGMPADVLARAGEPFFTTKEPGKGMGLGLFLTRSVLERLGGALELNSQPAVGTTAIVRLPAAGGG